MLGKSNFSQRTPHAKIHTLHACFRADVRAGHRGKIAQTAFFLSLLVPGLGELYAGAKIRAVGFMGAEALTWTAYVSWRGKGNDIKEEFRAYADQHLAGSAVQRLAGLE